MLLWLVFAFCTGLNAETKKLCGYTFNLKADRNGSVYKKGEKARFLLRVVDEDGEPAIGIKVKLYVSKDGFGKVAQVEGATDEDGEIGVNGSLGEAGFLLCSASVNVPAGDGTYRPLELEAGAGFDPLEIGASMPVPQDFTAFWRGQLDALDKVPVNAKLTPVDAGDPSIEVFDVECDSSAGKVRAYYARPKGAKAGSCPALIYPQGAGVHTSYIENAKKYARLGFIALDFNAHGVENGRENSFYENLSATTLKGYPYRGMDNIEKSYFRGMILRAVRAAQFLISQPEWDGRNFVTRGSSQGAGQAIAIAALCDKVSFLVAFVPAMSDHTGIPAGRISGWPHFLTPSSDLSKAGNIIKTARYVDGMNFASLVKCPALFAVGYRDTTCPPTAVYATYSNVKTPKKIYVGEEMGHYPLTDEAYKLADDAILEAVGIKKR